MTGPARPRLGPTRTRARRQSGRLTRRELRQVLSGAGRKWVKEVWQASERYSLRLVRLSPISSPLATELTDQYMAEHNLGAAEMKRALFLTLVAGYSARAVLAVPTGQPALARSAPRPADVRAIAASEFDTVMTLPPEVWRGFVATATMKLQARHASSTLRWHHLDRERVETLLRIGYVLRCLDEAAGSEPELRED